MKSILSVSLCTALLTVAVPALAATTTTHHHMMKHHGGRKGMKSAQGGDAAVQDLNSKSLAAARSGQPLDVGGSGSSSGASTPTSSGTGAASSTAAPTGSGTAAPGG